MSHSYKEARVCECGFTTSNRGHWSTHKKYRCEYRESKEDSEKEQLKEQVQILKEELAAKDEQLKEQREEIKMFEKLLAERFVELQEEVKRLRKRKPSRISRSEPERRKIAQRQNWKCAGETCDLVGELEAYDLDHILPLSQGGEDVDNNLQALCPACHRRKTDKERLVSSGN